MLMIPYAFGEGLSPISRPYSIFITHSFLRSNSPLNWEEKILISLTSRFLTKAVGTFSASTGRIVQLTFPFTHLLSVLTFIRPLRLIHSSFNFPPFSEENFQKEVITLKHIALTNSLHFDIDYDPPHSPHPYYSHFTISWVHVCMWIFDFFCA